MGVISVRYTLNTPFPFLAVPSHHVLYPLSLALTRRSLWGVCVSYGVLCVCAFSSLAVRVLALVLVTGSGVWYCAE